MIRAIFFSYYFLVVSSVCYSQVVDLNGPLSWNHASIKGNPTIPTYVMPSFDLDKVLREDSISSIGKHMPFKFGFNHKIEIDIIKVGERLNLAHGTLYRVRFRSPGALSINLVFDQFYLPKGAHIYLYSSDRKYIVGAYTSINNNSQNILGSDLVKSDEIIVELYEPNLVAGKSVLHVGGVVHAYKDLDNLYGMKVNESGACNLDVICPAGSPWGNEIKSVTRIISGSTLCTGTLINNTSNDGVPYVITAEHCNPQNMGSAVFRFNYDSPICGSQAVANSQAPAGSPQTINGASVVASNSDSDFGLVLLNSAPPANYNVYYSGWKKNNAVPSTGVCIHHPSGDVKKISFDDDPLQTTSYGTATNNMWEVETWERSTTTEGGSSGAGLWDQDHHFIGQLYGGSAACGNFLSDVFGKFSMSWDGNNSSQPTARLRDWLDPANTGLSQIDGYSPSISNLAIDVAVVSVDSPKSVYCSAYIPVSFNVKNNGIDTITSMLIDISLDGVIVTQYNWAGNLPSGSSATIDLPNSVSVYNGGSHQLEIFVNQVNGQTDGNNSNNLFPVSFTNYPNTTLVNLNLELDCWGSETSWEITDDNNGNILWEVPSNNYPDISPMGYAVNERICLNDGCYTFSIYDTYGDGMSGAQYVECDVNGDFSLDDQWGLNNYVSMSASNANYGSVESHPFCIYNTGRKDFLNTNIVVYPNPVNNALHIYIAKDYGNTLLAEISNIQGQLLNSFRIDNEHYPVDVSRFNKGYYFLKITNVSGEVYVINWIKN